MTAAVAIVTDSTAYLPGEAAVTLGVTVVPLRIAVDGDQSDEADIAHAPGDWSLITTSRPSPGSFATAYDQAARSSATAIVSVHVSGEMSGTIESAALAASGAAVPVHVVDSRTIGVGLGFVVIAAAEAAAAGAAPQDVAAAAASRSRRTYSLFYVDTLDHLRRGGRIGAAASLTGSALTVKPLLHITDGRIAPLEKVRTSARGLARLEELAVELAAGQPVDIVVQHVMAPGRAESLADRLRARMPGLRELHVAEVGPIIGAHAGPGALGVVISHP
jgi:DegV family protein with EDD domain